ncbi:hypothetical protein E2562_034623 [Oryza meyeriana var. granulata]|uniref:Uncharacterized protein n=1 Tax=Oryza meyeriana var. granulata TaxID=110450 RepID=A0A6G1E5B5_9ORYZ|nr:hypothetical protein E2562_034623 [Oryza meyeriana var. granulata]
MDYSSSQTSNPAPPPQEAIACTSAAALACRSSALPRRTDARSQRRRSAAVIGVLRRPEVSILLGAAPSPKPPPPCYRHLVPSSVSSPRVLLQPVSISTSVTLGQLPTPLCVGIGIVVFYLQLEPRLPLHLVGSPSFAVTDRSSLSPSHFSPCCRLWPTVLDAVPPSNAISSVPQTLSPHRLVVPRAPLNVNSAPPTFAAQCHHLPNTVAKPLYVLP